MADPSGQPVWQGISLTGRTGGSYAIKDQKSESMKIMKNKSKIRLDIVSLICAIIITIFSAAPLFNEHTDAMLLTLIFGSIGTGTMLSNLIHDLRQKKDYK